MRKKADDSAPPLKKTDDAAEIKEAQQALGRAHWRRARRRETGRRSSRLKSPRSSARLIRPETKDPDTKALLKEKKDQPKPAAVPLWKIRHAVSGKAAARHDAARDVSSGCRKLPADIDYRFVGKHLILRDVRANTIIDFATNVIP